jgi:hypothetical protein
MKIDFKKSYFFILGLGGFSLLRLLIESWRSDFSQWTTFTSVLSLRFSVFRFSISSSSEGLIVDLTFLFGFAFFFQLFLKMFHSPGSITVIGFQFLNNYDGKMITFTFIIANLVDVSKCSVFNGFLLIWEME